jgi:hypothetical protein
MNASANISHLPSNNTAGKKTITASDFESMVQRKKEELLNIAFRGLAETMSESINEYIESRQDAVISNHLSTDLFNTDQYSIAIDTDYIAQLKDNFFDLLHENLKEYFDQTPEKETKQQIASTKSQLTDNKAGIQKIMQNVLGLLQEHGWVTEATFETRSWFLKSLTLSTPLPTPEEVKVGFWKKVMSLLP